jgi:hypothetical protein
LVEAGGGTLLSNQFNLPTAPSFLWSGQHEFMPSTDDLESQLDELSKVRVKHYERAQSAAMSLRACEEQIRQIMKREKGKAKTPKKIKRERDCA